MWQLLQKYLRKVFYVITRAVASIVPATMINARSISENRMEILVQILFERKWLSAIVADKAKAQFS